jgi:hypothetical protein
MEWYGYASGQGRTLIKSAPSGVDRARLNCPVGMKCVLCGLNREGGLRSVPAAALSIFRTSYGSLSFTDGATMIHKLFHSFVDPSQERRGIRHEEILASK